MIEKYDDEQRAETLALLKQASEKLGEREYDAVASRSFQLGQVVALQDEAARLRVKSGELFAAGKDERAKILRDLADDLEQRASEMRKTYDANFPR